jgi:hypothetical protein
MAVRAKELGFSALVLTDHVYRKENSEYGMVPEKWKAYGRAVHEAKEILPVIVGCEVPYKGEEVLVFGSTAVKEIWTNFGIVDTITDLKKRHNCAVILCHPNNQYHEFLHELDGFERYNGGTDFFRKRPPIEGIPGWCNSDAHSADRLEDGWNEVNKKITVEDELIHYIKKGVQPNANVNSRVIPDTGSLL